MSASLDTANRWEMWTRHPLVWTERYFRWRDLMPLTLLASALLLFLESNARGSRLTTAIGLIYLVVFAYSVVDTARWRRTRDRASADLLHGLFAQLNQQVFANDRRTRFTLFVQSPMNPGLIVPWYRYFVGVDDPIAEAGRSYARYRKAEGVTGQAWDKPTKLLLAYFPRFLSRAEFEKYYIDVLGVAPEVSGAIGSHMMDVRALLAYGFVDQRGQFLGVLSLDLSAAPGDDWDQSFNEQKLPPSINLDASATRLILQSIGTVLATATKSQRL